MEVAIGSAQARVRGAIEAAFAKTNYGGRGFEYLTTTRNGAAGEDRYAATLAAGVARAVDELAREIDELRAGLVGDRARA
jgi:hypothetical protein